MKSSRNLGFQPLQLLDFNLMQSLMVLERLEIKNSWRVHACSRFKEVNPSIFSHPAPCLTLDLNLISSLMSLERLKIKNSGGSPACSRCWLNNCACLVMLFMQNSGLRRVMNWFVPPRELSALRERKQDPFSFLVAFFSFLVAILHNKEARSWTQISGFLQCWITFHGFQRCTF